MPISKCPTEVVAEQEISDFASLSVGAKRKEPIAKFAPRQLTAEALRENREHWQMTRHGHLMDRNCP